MTIFSHGILLVLDCLDLAMETKMTATFLHPSDKINNEHIDSSMAVLFGATN